MAASEASRPESVRMARALELAERGLYTNGSNPRVGCVLVRDGQVVGEGWHARAGEPHAEVMAAARRRRAGAGRGSLRKRSSLAATRGALRPAPMR